MRIAYLLGENLSEHPGLKQKIEGQIACWEREGHELFRILHYSGSVRTPEGKEVNLDEELLYPLQNRSKIHQMARLTKQYSFIKKALAFVKPDLAYSRYLFPAYGIGNLSRYGGKLIFEINSDDSKEYFSKSTHTGWFNKLRRNNVLRMVNGMVFVTHELANSPSFSPYTKTRTVIGNASEPKAFSYIENPENIKPQLAFIGSPNQAWHGIDKLGLLARHLPECSIHIIGPNREECIKSWGKLFDNVIFHGYLDGEAAQHVLSKMDIGISTLALYRKGMNEACPLKVRQYLAHGLPVLAASDDTDISVKQDFYFQLPNNEENITPYIDHIRNFVYTVFGNSKLRAKTRLFAETQLGVEKKESERLAFFHKVLGINENRINN